jgi:hypothetical protein
VARKSARTVFRSEQSACIRAGGRAHATRDPMHRAVVARSPSPPDSARNLPSHHANDGGHDARLTFNKELTMRIAPLMTAVTFALGTMALAQSITYDFDKSTNFSRFRTYAWVRGNVLADELNHNRVVNAVSAQLAAKGLTRVEASAGPDLLVAYHATFDKDLQISGFSSGWGPYRFAGRSGVARAEEILTGTLAVDMVDAQSKTIIWRGMASKEIDVKADPSQRERNINRAAERLLKNYPPAK